MEKTKIVEAIKKAREGEKRKFTQSVDLVVNFMNYDLKREGKVEEFVKLTHNDKPKKICAFVGPEMATEAKKVCDEVIISTDFGKYIKPRVVRKLGRQYDYFIAQADMMPQIAKTFGKFFAPIGKLPNPKNGQIFPPKANLAPVVARLKDTVKLNTGKAPTVSCIVGTEKLDDEKLAENVLLIVDHLEHKLPQGRNNISSVIVKTSMGKPQKVE